MQAYHFPEEFPFDKVESATDYDYVRFGGEQQFLMPVHAETLMCSAGHQSVQLDEQDRFPELSQVRRRVRHQFRRSEERREEVVLLWP